MTTPRFLQPILALLLAAALGALPDARAATKNSALQDIAMHVYERNGGVVPAVCHGTAGIVDLTLANARPLVAGKRIPGCPETHGQQDAASFRKLPLLIRRTVDARGGRFHAGERDRPYIEVDGKLVTGQNYAPAMPVAQALDEILRQQAGHAPAPAAN